MSLYRTVLCSLTLPTSSCEWATTCKKALQRKESCSGAKEHNEAVTCADVSVALVGTVCVHCTSGACRHRLAFAKQEELGVAHKYYVRYFQILHCIFRNMPRCSGEEHKGFVGKIRRQKDRTPRRKFPTRSPHHHTDALH